MQATNRSEAINLTAIGVVNLASRLCWSAVEGQVIIDVATVVALGGARPVEPLDRWSIKGFAKPAAIFALKQPTAPSD